MLFRGAADVCEHLIQILLGVFWHALFRVPVSVETQSDARRMDSEGSSVTLCDFMIHTGSGELMRAVQCEHKDNKEESAFG